MNLESKKEKYYQWLVDHMLDQTDVDSEKITFRFVLEWMGEDLAPIVYRHIEPWSSSSFLYGQVRDYLERKMGIESGIESKIIWEKFVPQLWEKIRRITGYYGGFEVQLDESVNKDKLLMDTLLEEVLGGSYVDYEEGRKKTSENQLIYVPFDVPSYVWGRGYHHTIFDKPYYKSGYFISFRDYYKKIYPLNEKQLLSVWSKFVKIMREKTRSKGYHINESLNKKENFLKYIINDLVDKTKIDYDEEYIHFPLIEEPMYFGFFLSLPKLFIPLFFKKHCRNVYASSDEEIRYIWNQYKSTIRDKITDKDNINESTENEEKQRKYFYFIVDDLVNKTNIVTIRDMKFIELSSVLMTRYFSGKPHLSRTVPEEFEKYCKDVYGINKGFIYAVWGAYELKIHDKITNESDQH